MPGAGTVGQDPPAEEFKAEGKATRRQH
ncbi:MAG: hypothetical protein QOJ52_737, partial [Acidimicrobiaceae bacterium]|nr:hypothetical protein [Acidimicrobiaceae bacterium]